ncbi:peptide-binding protein [Sutcliffiella horikoshii]|uniref:Peptide-binding protein n=1 Tax=Sutcliffiella horikoshii TaxID=79883 RepID=A0A1Y0CLJ5_9BACI|nr:peptide-binding protein [Sutcliffiella horikoshii]ART75795.1 peptide-binding protein [Sutcliffiella horikoshii]TYS61072.1 peptide-binding protein [Sutcliffiella horikoshii]
MKQKSLLLIVLTLVLSLFLAACSGSNNAGTNTNNTNNAPAGENNEEPAEEDEEATTEPVQGGDLVIGSTGSPTMFNPLYSADTASSAIEGFIFDGLLTSDTAFETQLNMAESWDISEDDLVHTLKIKDGIKFHDGETLNADDVVFTLSIPLSEDYDGPRAGYFEKIESVEKVDDLTVKVTLNAVDPTIHIALGYPILPEHVLGEVPVAELGEYTEFNTKNPIGAGPFKFESWEDGQFVKVVANDDYWNGRPYLDSLTYRIIPDADALMTALAAGDIHYYTVPATDIATVKEWEANGQLKVESGLALSYTYLGYNLRNPLFEDKKVRQALTHALDRELIVESVMNGDGEVADVPESPLSWAYDEDVPRFEYDVEKAKAMLEEAGWTPGADGTLEKDGQKFEFTLKTNQGNKVREDIAVVVQEQFAELGIKVTPDIMEWSAFLADIDPPKWNFDAIILGWALSTDPDPSGIFHSKEIEEGLNFVGWSNPDADKLMDEANLTMDRDERAAKIQEINRIIAEEQPYTFLYYPNAHHAMPTNLEGTEFHARDEFYKINEWWLNPNTEN